MRRKLSLLASAAGAALIFGQPAFADGLYFSTFGGANFVSDHNNSTTSGRATLNENFDFNTGFVIGSAVGLELDRWLHGLKVELEASYRRNKLDGHWSITTSGSPFIVGADALESGSINGHSSVFALMANAWYEFDIGTRFKPYFGGGVGWARSRLDGAFDQGSLISSTAVNPFNGWVVENDGFAYQLGAGITSQIMPGVSLGLGYRYFDAPDTDLFFSGKILAGSVNAQARTDSLKFDNVSHSVALTLTVDIN